MESINDLIGIDTISNAVLIAIGMVTIWKSYQLQNKKLDKVYQDQIKLLTEMLSKNQQNSESYQKETNIVLKEIGQSLKDSIHSNSTILDHVKESSQRIIDHIELITRNGK